MSDERLTSSEARAKDDSTHDLKRALYSSKRRGCIGSQYGVRYVLAYVEHEPKLGFWRYLERTEFATFRSAPRATRTSTHRI